MANGPTTVVLKPCFSTVTRYCPISKGLATYSPLASVLVTNVAPVLTLVTVTLAPGITAPLESLTVPAMEPVSLCANAPEQRNRKKARLIKETRTANFRIPRDIDSSRHRGPLRRIKSTSIRKVLRSHSLQSYE